MFLYIYIIGFVLAIIHSSYRRGKHYATYDFVADDVFIPLAHGIFWGFYLLMYLPYHYGVRKITNEYKQQSISKTQSSPE